MNKELRRVEQIAQSVDPRVESITPDTPILSRFRGRMLARFWTVCQSHSDGRLPPLQSLSGTALFENHLRPLTIPFVGVGTLIGLAQIPVPDIPILYLIAALVITVVAIMIWYGFCGLLCLTMNMVFIGRHSAEGVFPKGITTFGALAEVVRGSRGGWCMKCDYELTGLESDKCPECGTPCMSRACTILSSDQNPGRESGARADA